MIFRICCRSPQTNDFLLLCSGVDRTLIFIRVPWHTWIFKKRAKAWRQRKNHPGLALWALVSKWFYTRYQIYSKPRNGSAELCAAAIKHQRELVIGKPFKWIFDPCGWKRRSQRRTLHTLSAPFHIICSHAKCLYCNKQSFIILHMQSMVGNFFNTLDLWRTFMCVRTSVVENSRLISAWGINWRRFSDFEPDRPTDENIFIAHFRQWLHTSPLMNKNLYFESYRSLPWRSSRFGAPFWTLSSHIANWLKMFFRFRVR